MSFSVQGNAGVAGALIDSGVGPTAVADSNGNYVLQGLSGAVTLTPTLASYTFTPSTLSLTVTANTNGANFSASLSAGQGWSAVDSRDASAGAPQPNTSAGTFPNSTINDGQGNNNYTVPAYDSRVSGPPIDSRADVPKDSRANKPTNSRVAPPFGEAGEP